VHGVSHTRSPPSHAQHPHPASLVTLSECLPRLRPYAVAKSPPPRPGRCRPDPAAAAAGLSCNESSTPPTPPRVAPPRPVSPRVAPCRPVSPHVAPCRSTPPLVTPGAASPGVAPPAPPVVLPASPGVASAVVLPALPGVAPAVVLPALPGVAPPGVAPPGVAVLPAIRRAARRSARRGDCPIFRMCRPKLWWVAVRTLVSCLLRTLGPQDLRSPM
jgi:hypothetical protein